MTITIPIEEIDPEYLQEFRWNRAFDLHLDYATNAIHGKIRGDAENRDLIFFRFKDYGFINDNRRNVCTISGGPGGILVTIVKNQN